jgi:hypothetical protein
MHIYTEHNYGEINCTGSIPMWILCNNTMNILTKTEKTEPLSWVSRNSLPFTSEVNINITTSVKVVIYTDCRFTIIKTTETEESSLSRQEWQCIFPTFNKKSDTILTPIAERTLWSIISQNVHRKDSSSLVENNLMINHCWCHQLFGIIRVLRCCIPRMLCPWYCWLQTSQDYKEEIKRWPLGGLYIFHYNIQSDTKCPTSHECLQETVQMAEDLNITACMCFMDLDKAKLTLRDIINWLSIRNDEI